jgi:hypothetical protein
MMRTKYVTTVGIIGKLRLKERQIYSNYSKSIAEKERNTIASCLSAGVETLHTYCIKW